MKYKLLLIVFIFVSFCQISCDKKSIVINKVAEYNFRRFYSGIIEASKEESDSIISSSPEIIDSKVDNQALERILSNIGIVVNGKLDLKKLNLNYSQITKESIDTNYKFCRVFYDENINKQVLEVKSNGKKIKRILINQNPIKYQSLDLIKGGNPEIILLENIYFMNGDNYNLQIFEVK